MTTTFDHMKSLDKITAAINDAENEEKPDVDELRSLRKIRDRLEKNEPYIKLIEVAKQQRKQISEVKEEETIQDRMQEAAEKMNLDPETFKPETHSEVWQDKKIESIKPTKKIAPDMLEESAQLYRQRNSVYGDSYKKQGQLMKILFPNGVELKTVKDFNRMTVFVTILSKILRYSNDFSNPHDDSVLDNITYFAMLLELDRGE